MGMKVMASIVLVSSVVVFSSMAQAGPVDDLAMVFKGRVGTATEDSHIPHCSSSEARVGHRGDTLEAMVTIVDVVGSMEADTATMVVSYDGTYERQSWTVPCQKVPNELGGLGKRRLYGKYHFKVTGKVFRKPVIAWGQGFGYGEITDPNHDSNILAIRAVQNAIGSAVN